MDKWLVPLASLHNVLHEVESEMAQSGPSIETTMHVESVITAQTDKETTDKIDATENEQLRTLLPDSPYAMR